jgi:hypothetical protein
VAETPNTTIDADEARACLVLAATVFASNETDLKDFLKARPGTSRRASEFATAHLITRSVADAHAAMLLFSQGYVAQGYSALRTIFESLNLVRLFAQSPEQADAWALGDYKQFSPARVREQLGDGPDELYGRMCARSHPRFEGARVSSYVRLSGEARRTIILLGGLPLWHPAVLIAATEPSIMLARVALACVYLPSESDDEDASIELCERLIARSEPVEAAIQLLLRPVDGSVDPIVDLETRDAPIGDSVEDD